MRAMEISIAVKSRGVLTRIVQQMRDIPGGLFEIDESSIIRLGGTMTRGYKTRGVS